MLPPELAEIAPIYRALAAQGFAQEQVDGMELWVIAELLGLNVPGAGDSQGLLTEDEFTAMAKAQLIARVEASEAQAASTTDSPGPAMIAG